MTHHGNSFITYFAKKTKLSDIEYLAIKEFDGKVKSDEGTLSATGTLCTLTASSGKDMYVARAKVTFYNIDTGSTQSINQRVELRINGVEIETAVASVGWNTNGAGPQTVIYEFVNVGRKVAATQLIVLEVVGLSGDTDVRGVLECFEEDTGVSPAI